MAAHAAARAAIVLHPGKVPLDRVRRAIEAAELSHGWLPSSWHETSAADAGRAAAQEALAGEPSVVIVAGGDGTVRTVGSVLAGSGTPMALLPFGTGNLLARNLGAPLADVDASVAIAFGGGSREIDVAVAELEDEAGERSSHAFLVMAGIGLDAAMAEQTSALAKRHVGWLAYVPPIARSITANRLFQLRYRVDGGAARTARAHTIIVGNCGTLTGGMLLLPGAVIDDGLLDVVMLRPKGRFGWARIGTRLTVQGVANRSVLGRRMLRVTPDLQALAYAQGRRFDVRFEIPHVVQLDGDVLGTVSRARITIRPADLRVATGVGG
ncbi:diacylglycerol/lipid kinase family protein [Agrococcus baldri]|uniref:Diacylglycerol kinase n=1 Tax=Agrococcus baldri TaxID=153730 RepID=A0AA87UVU2_9MICO|nr:diacylglycerol kinase family protein [Agrococcus baldri]GEK78857.1 diacylglycerol kinase [Agrococcus baldri]